MFWQGSLLGTEPEVHVDTTFRALERIELDSTSWLDVARNWMSGADELFEALASATEWRQRIVTMYQRTLPEPRLTSWWREGSSGPRPLAVVDEARRVLSARYGCHFDSVGYNWYRSGDDSVAWHGDRFARTVVNPTIAIVSIGAARPFRVRPKRGGRSQSFDLGHGDLLVMGGACQHDWQHSVPKTTKPVGPRISVTFRHDADYAPRARRHDITHTGASESPRQ